ncbi:MAG TPA: beta-N-acetylhexosaminidase [Xanthobacteraceae bacterium]|nr:beta-N-acetylhexosaminidase [Xanthobacteraceae bacterium]
MADRACILGCAGPRLTADEHALFGAARPWGFILFKRNIEDPAQVSNLTQEFRAAVGRPGAPVFVDQEGGRVQRLQPPRWPVYPPAAKYGEIYARDRGQGLMAARLGAELIAADLIAVGINADCLPVADLRRPEGHDVIGDRAYGADPNTVAKLARAAADGLLAGGVLPVLKHIPGHGRARADSHKELPVVEAPLAELDRTDFESFRLLNDLPIAMTAHVVYAAFDKGRPATTSPVVIGEVIRRRIGFGGLLLTDDLSMNALSGSLAERAEAAFAAGCDMALHCNGRLAEMRQVAAAAPTLTGEAAGRAAAALACLRPATKPGNLDEARRRFSAMIA